MATKKLRAEAFNKHSHQDNRGLRRIQPKLICLAGDAASIESLGRFLCECASEMRSDKPFHRHFRDYESDWDESILDVTVDRAEHGSARKV